MTQGIAPTERPRPERMRTAEKSSAKTRVFLTSKITESNNITHPACFFCLIHYAESHDCTNNLKKLGKLIDLGDFCGDLFWLVR
jgi:hypothetical protein